MKKLSFLLLTLTIATAATAATVNRQQARQQAAQFLQQHGAQLGTESTTVRGRRTQAADQPLYVFNTVDSRGFVVVSGDDRTDAILAYTLQGSYDDANVPENLRHWFDQMTAEIEALDNAPAAARAESKPRQVSIHNAVGPLLATTWNQGNSDNSENTDGIYNIRLPQIGNAFPCTGCVATAGAQIMYYYKWPETTQEVPGYNSSLPATSYSLPAKEFEWNKMKTSYTSADANSDAAYAVADLMLYAGWAANMSYGIDGSSSNQVTLASNMVKYFGYDPYWQHVSRNNYPVADWDELIYNELANRRPVIYDGSSDRGGHAFICDGYDGKGFYHFNWGWGGGSNGYFKLQATNPDGADGFPGYIFGNTAIIGLQPYTGITPDNPNIDDEWEEPVIEGLVATAYNATLEGLTITTGLQNGNDGEHGFGLGLAELNDDGTLNVIDKSYEYYENWNLPSWSFYPGLTFNLSSLSLAEGTHRLVPVSKLNGEEEWKRCRPGELWFEVIVDGEEIVIAKQHPVVDIKINRFEMTSSGIPGQSQSVIVNLTNKGDNISETFYLYYDNIFSNYVYSLKSLKIAAGSTKEFVLSTFDPLPEGKHKLQLRKGYKGEILKEIEVDIKIDLAATAFTVNSDGKFAGASIPVDVTVESHAGDYTAPLYFFASQSNTKGSPAYIAGTAIPGGGSEDVRFYFTPTTGGTWNLWVATDESGNNVIGTVATNIEDAPSGTVTLKLNGSVIVCNAGGKATYTLNVKNSGSVVNYRPLEVRMWEQVDGAWKGRWQTEAVTIQPGEEQSISAIVDNLEEGKQYLIQTQYMNSYNGEWTWIGDNCRFTYNAPTPGNLGGDENLDADDVNALVNYLLRGEPLPEGANADVDGNGAINIADVAKLIELILSTTKP